MSRVSRPRQTTSTGTRLARLLADMVPLSLYYAPDVTALLVA